MLDYLPDEFGIEELVDKLLFIEETEQGIQDAEGSKVLSFAESQVENGK
jgi:hypothetical protein